MCRRLLVILSVLFWSTSAAQAQASPDLCLKRASPDSPDDYKYTKFHSQKDKEEWRLAPLIVHSASNKICGSGDKCYVRPLELMYVLPKPASDKLTLLRFPGSLVSAESIELSLDSDGRFLVGSGADYDIFLLYSGTRACAVNLGSRNDIYNDKNGDAKNCPFFEVETFPRGRGEWRDYRPDVADWLPVADCPVFMEFLQPGGGGGHEPPG